jgi:hypothetical protein
MSELEAIETATTEMLDWYRTALVELSGQLEQRINGIGKRILALPISEESQHSLILSLGKRIDKISEEMAS